jgi:3-hydroxybutyryl-CoA dehydrogenase
MTDSVKSSNRTSRVAVLGLGTMGHGIAQTFAMAGCDVACFDQSADMRGSLVERVRKNLAAFVDAGLVEPGQIEPTLARLQLVDTEDEAVAEAQFVTEAVPEDLEIKQALFARVERVVASGAILASNSSSFPISQSGSRIQRPERALVTHWFNPPHLTPVVEVVPGPRTSPDTVQKTLDLLLRLGKQPIRLQRELPGFLVNRVQVAIQREVWDLVGQGVATPEEIDTAIRGTIGFRFAALGPLEIHDFGGLDIQLATYRNLVSKIRSDTTPPKAIQELTAEGLLGVKTGRGFYDYPPDRLEARRARRDSLLLKLKKLLYSNDSAGKLAGG